MPQAFPARRRHAVTVFPYSVGRDGATYDVFVSYAHTDRVWAEPRVAALRERGLAVFFDESEIEDFARITSTISAGLAQSKALGACYSARYPTRRACQWS